MPVGIVLQPHLTKLLQRTHQHWAWIPRDTFDEVIIRIHIGYERFFDWKPENGRRGRRVGPPKFKKRGKYRSAKFQTGYSGIVRGCNAVETTVIRRWVPLA